MRIEELERKTLRLFQGLKDVDVDLYQSKFVWEELEGLVSIKDNKPVSICGLHFAILVKGHFLFLNLEQCCAGRYFINDKIKNLILKVIKTEAFKKYFKEAEKFAEGLKNQHNSLKSLKNKENDIKEFVASLGLGMFCQNETGLKRSTIHVFSGPSLFVFILTWEDFEPVIEIYCCGLNLSSEVVLKIVSFLYSIR